jgi:hypothetical protein
MAVAQELKHLTDRDHVNCHNFILAKWLLYFRVATR